uniref:Uncharacterized protein n=1 Tax=Calcidiscus leptoporus TaxID=127549 RepID=A0A7S0NMR5_9EUKA
MQGALRGRPPATKTEAQEGEQQLSVLEARTQHCPVAHRELKPHRPSCPRTCQLNAQTARLLAPTRKGVATPDGVSGVAQLRHRARRLLPRAPPRGDGLLQQQRAPRKPRAALYVASVGRFSKHTDGVGGDAAPRGKADGVGESFDLGKPWP